MNLPSFAAIWLNMAKLLSREMAEFLQQRSCKVLRESTVRMLASGIPPEDIYAAVLGEFARLHHDVSEFTAQYKAHMQVFCWPVPMQGFVYAFWCGVLQLQVAHETPRCGEIVNGECIVLQVCQQANHRVPCKLVCYLSGATFLACWSPSVAMERAHRLRGVRMLSLVGVESTVGVLWLCHMQSRQ